ncbi:ankyrin repeat domain-containing protein [Escherichia coli]|nr:ankyrin repeat domain-containing protein [Escherichia coli]
MTQAAFLGETEVVSNLIKLGVDLDARGDLGRTALHEAVSNGYFDIVKLLVESGADLTIKDEFGKTALELAEVHQNYKIVEWLSHYRDHNPIPDFSVLINIYGKRYFGGEIIDTDARTELGEGVLHIAVRKRRQLDVRCFIQHGADINAKANNGFDFTPLHYSIGIGDFDMMKLLLKLGADIYLESEMGYSPMDLAILIGDKRIIFYLYGYISHVSE